MSETPPPAAPASEQPGGAPTPPPPPPPPAPAPPWGSDDEFDPAKAWNLISNLRGEVAGLKPLAQRAKELEDQSKTELERITDDRDGHKTRADTAEAQVARLTAALTHNLSMEDVELLGTGTAEEIEQRAKRLAERIGAGSATPQVPRGPVETLRPGAVPSTPIGDDDALLQSLKRVVGAP